MKERPKKTEFILTPDQHRARAAEWRKRGNHEQANCHETCARIITRKLIVNSGLFDNEFFGGKAPFKPYKAGE